MKKFNTKIKFLPTMIVLLGLQLLAISGHSQNGCNFSLGCNAQLNVSVDTDCTATITARMMLETELEEEGDYKVIIMDKYNYTLPSNVVDLSYAGEELTVKVQHIECGISCWGTITIENKLTPFVVECRDTVLTCVDDFTPGVQVPYPVFGDLCSEGVEIFYTDSIDIRPCSDIYEQVIYRNWFAIDADGYTTSCTQTISVLRIDISEVIFPPNFNDIDQPALECSEIDDKFILENGAPSPEITGYPEGIECSMIQYQFEDLVFELCGDSKKILRQWFVLDWCTGEDTMANQIIKILDTQAPVCTDAGKIYVIPMDKWKCTASFMVPEPAVLEECSEYTYTVGHKPKKDDDDPFSNLQTYDLVFVNGGYKIPALPQDTNYLVYTIIDDCGNSSQCYQLVVVEDNQAPSAICEGYTVIALDNSGLATLLASSIDDYSWDNCAIDSFAIKKEFDSCGYPLDLEFGNKLHFCCDDASREYVMVTFRVWDINGNYNDCKSQVKVQDKQPPILTCPEDVVIICTDDIDDLSITGEATAIDNCEPKFYYIDDTTELNKCGVGSVWRTWYAQDPNGFQTDCIQRIDVDPEYVLEYKNINWPKDRSIYGCDENAVHPDGIAGKPIIAESVCMDIAVAYRDDVFYDVEDVCMKILRTWKVIDWCTFDSEGPRYIVHEQIIKLYDSKAPEILTPCGDRVYTTDLCTQEIEVIVGARDDCTPAVKLKFRYIIDIDDDGILDISGNGNSFKRYLPVGKHKVKFEVVDECENVTTCEFNLIVKTTKAPTPICLGQIVWVMESDGDTEVWAVDFNQKSINACGDEKGLIYSFTEDGKTPSMLFDCDYIPNGISNTIPLKMWVIDTFGRSEYCDVVLKLQDNNINDACTNDPTATANIIGQIYTEAKDGLSEVEVGLDDMTMGISSKSITRGNGEFQFQNVEYFHNYHLEPYKNDDADNGVTTLDLVYIQQYLMGLRQIESPYKLIAADINGDMRVSGADLLEIRKLILGYSTAFESNTSWRFIPADFSFSNPAAPWDYHQELKISELIENVEKGDFIGVKIGDINGNARVQARNNQVSPRSSSSITLVVTAKDLDGYKKLVFKGLSDENLLGMQFTLDFNQQIAFGQILPGVLSVSPENILVQENEGRISFSWGKITPQTIDDLELFSLILSNDLDLSRLEINSSITQSEAYGESGDLMDLALEKIIDPISPNAFTLYQNSPNPFRDRTKIEFSIPKAGKVDFAIHDISGKSVYSFSNHYKKGMNQFTLDRSMIPGRGIVFYTLMSGDQSITKKMVIID